MKYVNESRIKSLLENASSARERDLDSVLAKARSLKRLSLEEAAVLLTVKDKDARKKIFETARFVKEAIYGSRWG